MRKTILTAAEHVNQLQAIVAAQASPEQFSVGQLVRRKPISLAIADRAPTHLAIGAVVESVPNMREFTGEFRDTTGPAMVVAALDPEGGYHEALVEAWEYELVTPDEIAALTGQTSH